MLFPNLSKKVPPAIAPSAIVIFYRQDINSDNFTNLREDQLDLAMLDFSNDYELITNCK